MKKYIIYTLILTASIPLFISMKINKPYDFVLGHWFLQKKNISIEEHWEEKNGVYTGWSKTWKDTTLISSEVISIIEEDGIAYYVANVSGHNDNKPVKFKLIESANDRLVFENEEHDFPKRIIYTRVNRNEMLAQIEGNVGGKTKTIDFPYTRMKD